MTKAKNICAFVLVMLLLTNMLFAGCATTVCTHSLKRVAPKAATCTEDGNREYFVCENCNECFADEEGNVKISSDKYTIKTSGHRIMKHNGKAASCVVVGVEEYYECRDCGQLFADQNGTALDAAVTIDKLNHNCVKVDAKAPTDYEYGWKEHYACSMCGNVYSDAQGKTQISMDSIRLDPLQDKDFAYKIAYTQALNWQSFNGTNGANYISAVRTTADNLPATQFTIKANATANSEVAAWLIHEINSTKPNGINLRIPTFSGKKKTVDLIVSNDGGQEVKFYYYAENNGDRGGVTVTIAPNEKKTVTFEVNPGNSIGCNYAFRLLSNITTETKLTMYGYFDCTDELTGISLLKQATTKTFSVGDKFTTKGVVVKAEGTSYDDVVIANYTSSIENGYTFTSEDIGTKTVMIKFGKFNVTYDITVTE